MCFFRSTEIDHYGDSIVIPTSLCEWKRNSRHALNGISLIVAI